ncbi:Mechanosensitive ion channel protein Msy2 [Purpureocillium lavendulum]|uniref:Mechanosensitive ion channel protein Msy2 n=1 Tax=Purpureocillium lavendulum TaxID=1247861 RepID=A0AB34FD22_9HYPO|nr:Mechanosensitive ion channel protein Msy2 [Purpureocillium lavendulum]
MKFTPVTAVAFLSAAVIALPTSNFTPSMLARTQRENRATTCSASSTDSLIFSVSINTFEKARTAKNPSQCDWSSDNCSKSPDKPAGYNFILSCQRHDFGYRNTKAQKRFTKAMKSRIDDNFKKDLYKYCSQFSGWKSWKGVECRRIADVYYAAVRRFGKRVAGFGLTGTDKREPQPQAEIELDPDIPGQVIPQVVQDDGADVDDLEELFHDE